MEDEAYYDDGRHSSTGDWSAYLTFIQHAAVWPVLEGFDFGSSEEPATHWLVLDRQQRTLYAAPVDTASRFLHQQWPQRQITAGEALSGQDMMQQLLDTLDAQNWQEVPAALDQAEMMRQMQEHQELVRQMQAFLDQSLSGHDQSSHNGHGEGGVGL